MRLSGLGYVYPQSIVADVQSNAASTDPSEFNAWVSPPANSPWAILLAAWDGTVGGTINLPQYGINNWNTVCWQAISTGNVNTGNPFGSVVYNANEPYFLYAVVAPDNSQYIIPNSDGTLFNKVENSQSILNDIIEAVVLGAAAIVTGGVIAGVAAAIPAASTVAATSATPAVVSTTSDVSAFSTDYGTDLDLSDEATMSGGGISTTLPDDLTPIASALPSTAEQAVTSASVQAGIDTGVQTSLDTAAAATATDLASGTANAASVATTLPAVSLPVASSIPGIPTPTLSQVAGALQSALNAGSSGATVATQSLLGAGGDTATSLAGWAILIGIGVLLATG